jgi:hypothetical protein
MTDSYNEQKLALDCLRIASDLMQLSRETPDPKLRTHCLRMAGIWTDRAAPGPTDGPTPINHVVH